MFQPLSLSIGLRYLRAKRSTYFTSAFSTICMSIGVAALLVVLSVMNGFEQELRARTIGLLAHITVADQQRGLPDWQAADQLVQQQAGVIAAAPFVQGEAMLKRGRKLRGVSVMGLDPEREAKVSNLIERFGEQLKVIQADSRKVLVGKALADEWGLQVGDRLDLLVPQIGKANGKLLPKLRRFKVGGTVTVGVNDFDRSLVVMHLADAQAAVGLGQAVTGLRIKLNDMFAAPDASLGISTALREAGLALSGSISDWTRHNRNFFRALKTQKGMIFVVLSLIVAVAAFNMVASLIMLVLDKRADIAILRTLGASPSFILKVFVIQGCGIALMGTLLGLLLGVLLVNNLQAIVGGLELLLDKDFLQSDVYPLSDFPTELRMTDVVAVVSLASVAGWLSTLYPAWQASRLQPAPALHAEG